MKREKITQDRSHAIDAQLVRLMKSRKKMTQNELIGELCGLALNFSPDLALVKKRIESLIERDYMARDKGDEQMLIYRA